QEPGAGPVDAREAEGRPSDRKSPRDGSRVTLPGTGKALHSRQRGSDQELPRVRRPPSSLTHSSTQRPGARSPHRTPRFLLSLTPPASVVSSASCVCTG